LIIDVPNNDLELPLPKSVLEVKVTSAEVESICVTLASG
jgi:hypothetical protein